MYDSYCTYTVSYDYTEDYTGDIKMNKDKYLFVDCPDCGGQIEVYTESDTTLCEDCGHIHMTDTLIELYVEEFTNEDN